MFKKSLSTNYNIHLKAIDILKKLRKDSRLTLLGICIQNEMRCNFWGKIKTLHTFNAVNRENPALTANWLISKIWIFSMDAIAIGLIYLCISSWIMWYNIRKAIAGEQLF